jgi:TonB-linked SusC/RagA family outer membrane protein
MLCLFYEKGKFNLFKYLSMRKILLLFVLSFALLVANAQEKKVTGLVTEASSGEPLVGVTVLVKGTTNGTVTNFDGKFDMSVPTGATLVVSFVGMEAQEIPVEGETSFNIKMKASSEQLDDVVVTALGIKREKKALGYSVQDVKSDEITRTNPTNIVSSLAGKVAGAQIVTSSGQVGASSTIKIRGNKSFTGSAEPLFVVDGTPIMNTISSAMSDNTRTDFGNAAMDIDPANIESVSVLKGASAAALYGSRASNGVILITTKKGAKKKGIGVEVSSSISFDNVYILPDYQDEYGQGGYGDEYYWKTNYSSTYDTYADYCDNRCFKWSLTGDGRRMDWDESWGARLDIGLMFAQMDSPVDEDGNVTPTEWVSHPDNIKDFYRTGITTNNTVALSSSNDKSSGRLTLSHVKQEGTTPNTDQTKINIGLNSSFKLSDRLSIDANVNLSEIKNDNLPQQGNSMRNPLLEFNSWFGRQVDMNYLKQHYTDIVEYDGEKKAFNWMMDYDGQHNNPYWLTNVNTMSRQRKRVYGNVSANFKIAEGIDLMGRLGTDFYDEHRKYKYHQYSRDSWTDLYANATNGTFWEQFRMEGETNLDLLLKIDKKLSENWHLYSTLGSNYRYVNDKYTTTSGNNLVVPDFFSTSNIEGEPNVDVTIYEKKSCSVFGSANFAYKNYLFVDLTLRGDWSSTLPKENWNYWYPSANVGFVFTELFNAPKNFSFGKLRLGLAQVGNDTDPYQLTQTFSSVGSTFNDVNLFAMSSELNSYNLKPEKTTSYEIGTELKFFKNRLGADITYYNAKTSNQLLSVDLATSSGYDSWMKNAGSIRNQGVEVQLYATPVELDNGFSWDVSVNWAKNKNKVLSLDDGITELEINYLYKNTSLMAFEGKEWGILYGTTMERNSDGKVIVDDSGKPVTNSEYEDLGHVNPDWTGGVRNTFSYKNFSLSCLIDFRKGGDIFSLTKAVGQKAGILEVTVKDGIRENGMIVDGVYDDGVTIDGADVSGQTNTTRIAARSYWRSSRDWAELSIFDGSFVKLREISLSYALPKSLLSKVGVQSASVSVYGHNLALLYLDSSNDAHIDPEVSSGGTVAGTGFESYQMPATRTLGCKLSFKF